MSIINVCSSYQNLRNKIIRNDFFKKTIKLKQLSGLNESTNENIKNKYDSYVIKLNNIAGDINKIISKS